MHKQKYTADEIVFLKDPVEIHFIYLVDENI
jgi:hypothetical protein